MTVGKGSPDGKHLTATHTEGDIFDGFKTRKLVYFLQIIAPGIVGLSLRLQPHHLQGLVGIALTHGAIAGDGEVDII